MLGSLYHSYLITFIYHYKREGNTLYSSKRKSEYVLELFFGYTSIEISIQTCQKFIKRLSVTVVFLVASSYQIWTTLLNFLQLFPVFNGYWNIYTYLISFEECFLVYVFIRFVVLKDPLPSSWMKTPMFKAPANALPDHHTIRPKKEAD